MSNIRPRGSPLPKVFPSTYSVARLLVLVREVSLPQSQPDLANMNVGIDGPGSLARPEAGIGVTNPPGVAQDDRADGSSSDEGIWYAFSGGVVAGVDDENGVVAAILSSPTGGHMPGRCTRNMLLLRLFRCEFA